MYCDELLKLAAKNSSLPIIYMAALHLTEYLTEYDFKC